MSDTPRHARATVADLAAVPETMIGELIDGAVVTRPLPTAAHATVASNLVLLVGPAFQRGQGSSGRWLLLYEPALELGEDVLVPDHAGWRTERLPTVPDAPRIAIPPDWVCEILSPGAVRCDREVKLEIYARAGVGHAWLVDPVSRSLEVLRRDRQGAWLAIATFGQGLVRAEPFESVELDLDLLWIGLPPPADAPT